MFGPEPSPRCRRSARGECLLGEADAGLAGGESARGTPFQRLLGEEVLLASAFLSRSASSISIRVGFLTFHVSCPAASHNLSKPWQQLSWRFEERGCRESRFRDLESEVTIRLCGSNHAN